MLVNSVCASPSMPIGNVFVAPDDYLPNLRKFPVVKFCSVASDTDEYAFIELFHSENDWEIHVDVLERPQAFLPIFLYFI